MWEGEDGKTMKHAHIKEMRSHTKIMEQYVNTGTKLPVHGRGFIWPLRGRNIGACSPASAEGENDNCLPITSMLYQKFPPKLEPN